MVLSLFRFISYGTAASLMGIISRDRSDDLSILVIAVLLGLYTVLKILAHFRIWQRDVVTYAVLLGDLVICLALVLWTGGIDSPFLFYSLLPVITVALFFERRISLLFAGLSSLNLVLAETVLTDINLAFAPASRSHSLTAIAAYCLFSFLIATITYPSNLNASRRIENKAIIDERRRLRQEIHDGIAQVLAYVKTKTELLKKDSPSSAEKLHADLDEMYRLLSETTVDIREAIDALDVKLATFSLVGSLSSYIQEVGKKTGCQVQFTAPRKMPALHPAAQLQLLRVAQEALTNVRKHAAATQISVKLESLPRGVELVVEDNGCGFCPAERKGTGLGVMEERVASIGGVLTVNSSPGKGTEVKVKVPRR